jgi:hypothetical protein
MNYLLQGGSWFEADQMHWRKVLAEALADLPQATGEQRRALLQRKAYAEEQLGIRRADSAAVKTAEPAKAAEPAKKASNKALGAFAALADDSEEEE